jgi:hypothetical protein
MTVTRINYAAKAEHFATLASRAAYNAATAVCPSDRDAWEERAAVYDERAAEYETAARVRRAA